MRKRSLALAVGLLCCGALHGADAEDLIQIYRDALANDPIYASARANWAATQEVLPQARAGLLPLVSLLGIANQQDFHENLHSDPTTPFVQRFPTYSYTVSASQPLYRAQNWISYDQAKQRPERAPRHAGVSPQPARGHALSSSLVVTSPQPVTQRSQRAVCGA